jgi:small subunit ribosomal protein S20
MPIIKSAIKKARQAEKNKIRNTKNKIELKNCIRSTIDAVKANKKEEASKSLQLAYKKIDLAVKKHLLHKNNANRKKSRLSKLVDGLKTAKK